MNTHTTTYLIIGGGIAADAAIRAIIKNDPSADLALISEDSHLPYDRPALSKELIVDSEVTIKDIIRDTTPYEGLVNSFLGRSAVRLEPDLHLVFDSLGEQHHYKKLLLATGGRPRQLPGPSNHLLSYRSLSDFKNLEEQIVLGHRVAVVGGGFIGTEIAASLTESNCDPFIIHPHKHLGQDRFPESLCRHIDGVYQDHGVDLLPEQRAVGIVSSGSMMVVETDAGGKYAADFVVSALGIDPNVELAEEAGLNVGDGILVNHHLQTSHPDVYAAGDNASAYRNELGRYARVEHEQNALEMGRVAGSAMTGNQDACFSHSPLYYSDFFDQGFEAVGELNSDHTMVEDWIDGQNKGVVYYLNDRQEIVGVLLWNLFGKTEEARTLMQNGPVKDPATLPGLIAA